jgi:outer membrane murein-binding lipoprotein Lpp
MEQVSKEIEELNAKLAKLKSTESGKTREKNRQLSANRAPAKCQLRPFFRVNSRQHA